MVTELNTFKEQIIKVLGYDSQVWDNKLDVSGVYDAIDATLLASGVDMIQLRIQEIEGMDRPIYASFGQLETKYNIIRDTYGK
jgi:hypothetical protein